MSLTKKDYRLKDLVRGEVNFPSDMVGDFVLLRSSGMPVYNFCCVIDDYLMKISHVFRGEEHLSNSLRQIMIYESLNWKPPQFGHLSLILGENRQKLSKRHGSTSVTEYKNKGFLPEAINNFLALLGWSSPQGQEIMSLNEITSQFDSDRLNPAAAIFDEKKLKWFNTSHLRSLPPENLWKRLTPLFQQEGLCLPENEAWRSAALEITKTSMETLADGPELFKPLSTKPLEFSSEALEVLSWESTSKVIQTWVHCVETCPDQFINAELFSRYSK